MENTNQKTCSYKVNIYLGKDLYEQIDNISEFLGLSVAQTSKLLLKTGLELSKVMESAITLGGQNESQV